MGTRNDHKLISKIALRYSERLNLSKSTTDIQRKRLGFYLLILEAVSHVKDTDLLISGIIDTDFCKTIFGIVNDDEGIDAVTIDEENHTINFFNFKYRENFKASSGPKLTDVANSMRFLARIANEDIETLDDRSREIASAVIGKLNSDDMWTMNLYLVSNENNGLVTDEASISQLQKQYGLLVHAIVMDDIISYSTESASNVTAQIFLNRDALMTYEEDEISSSKSYLIRVPVSDLVRITCVDDGLRQKYNLQDLGQLKTAHLDLGLLFDNVRGFLGQTKFNKNIIKTLTDYPSKFFMYNNGITLTAKNIQVTPQNANKKYLVIISGFQIVNGGQTLRSIYDYVENNFDEDNLLSANILVRIFHTEDDDILMNSIAEYTNSQNAISAPDLKSVSNLQITIERYLRVHEIFYIRKAGETGASNDGFKYEISMERMAQIIVSKNGNPDKASNQKKRLFEKDYDNIFYDKMNLDLLVAYTTEYYEIKKAYVEKGIKGYDQKYFYVLYLNSIKNNIVENIEKLEEVLLNYRPEEEIPEPRKLIQKGFKEELDKILIVSHI